MQRFPLDLHISSLWSELLIKLILNFFDRSEWSVTYKLYKQNFDSKIAFNLQWTVEMVL